MGDGLDLRHGLQVVDDLQRVLDVAFDSQGQGFGALQQQEGRERGQGGAGVAQQDGAHAGHEGGAAEGLIEVQAMVGRIRLGQGRELARHFGPVELAAFHDHAAEGGAVAADELGGRVHHDVCAVLDGTDEVRSAEGIVNDQRQAVLVGYGGNGVDIRDIAVGVAQSFQIDGLGVGLDGILHLSQIVCVHKGGGDAELGQGVLQQVVAAAVDGLLGHDVVTGLCQCFDGVGDGSGTGGGCQSSHAALQSSDALLEHVLRGVGQAAIDVAGICQTKAVCCVLAVAEHIGSGLIDGHGAGIGCGIGLLLANVKLQGLKFIVRHSILPLYLYL